MLAHGASLTELCLDDCHIITALELGKPQAAINFPRHLSLASAYVDVEAEGDDKMSFEVQVLVLVLVHVPFAGTPSSTAFVSDYLICDTSLLAMLTGTVGQLSTSDTSFKTGSVTMSCSMAVLDPVRGSRRTLEMITPLVMRRAQPSDFRSAIQRTSGRWGHC
jgi:hypothetical protein